MSSDSDSEWTNAKPEHPHSYFLRSQAALKKPKHEPEALLGNPEMPFKPGRNHDDDQFSEDHSIFKNYSPNLNVGIQPPQQSNIFDDQPSATFDDQPSVQNHYDSATIYTEERTTYIPQPEIAHRGFDARHSHVNNLHHNSNLAVPFHDGPIPPSYIYGKKIVPAWWWLGAHGGAGVTSLIRASASGNNEPWGADALRAWPNPQHEVSPSVVVVCRNNASGLLAAQDVARQAYEGNAPTGINIVGLVVMADAPGKELRKIRDFRQLVGTTYAKVWQVPWIDEWRAIDRESALPVHPVLEDVIYELRHMHAVTG